MTQPRRDGVYIWVIRLTRLFVGENSCERSSWAWDQHGNRSWDRGQRFFDQTGWQLAHITGIKENRRQ